jgi:hypothetical protein
MSKYTPDRWVVLEFDYDGDVIRKVFAGWYGGYLNGDSWKLSSGITNTREFDDRFEFENHSGSLYTCYKSAYGMGGYQSSVLAKFEREIEEAVAAGKKVSLKIIEEYNVETKSKLQA